MIFRRKDRRMGDPRYGFSYISFKNRSGKGVSLNTQSKAIPKKILVIDDDRGIVEVLEAILEYRGFEVVTDNGESIQRKIVKYIPDLILMDISLGRNNGSLICNDLKNDPMTKNIPVILISAHNNLQNYPQINQADDFIAKPFDMKELLNKISGLLTVNT